MGEATAIQWTGATWNPWHGCHKVSWGCDNCYMFAEKRMYGQDGNVVVRSKTKFNDPLRWARAGKSPEKCFTCSWSDWFIPEADEWRDEAWEIVRQTQQTVYQMLTKRAGRILSHLPADWGTGYPNVWLGVTVEGPQQKQRISTLRKVPAAVRFVSFEPLLADVGEVDLSGIHWAIIGGESGPGARPCDIQDWAYPLVEQCRKQGVAVFVKQIGAKPVVGGLTVIHKHRKGGEMSEWPEYLRIREFPRGR